jgi:protein required for attachment to host cells
MTHWILIADAASAKVYSTTAHKKQLELVREFANPQGRLKNHDLVTDGPGRLDKSGAPGTRSATAPQTTAHEEVINEFAHKLATFLLHEVQRQSFTSLSLAAPPHFLGLLRRSLATQVENCVRAALSRDLVHIPPHDLLARAADLIPPGVFI